MFCKCKRAQIIKNEVDEHIAHLRELWKDPDQRQTLYECPETGAQWLRDYPHSNLHGGGPAVLRKLPLKPDFSCYIRRKVDLACRCLAISKLVGDEAAEYAQFHLEKKAEDADICKIDFRCPITNLYWIMDFSLSRVPCGGAPILTKVADDVESTLTR
jgi:hypothetical protein